MVTLNPTLNPINAQQRARINENWDRITLRFSQLQLQINILSGETSVEEILQELNDAINNANTTVQGLVNDSETAIQNVNDKIAEVDNKLAELQTAINNANAATDATNSAISDARQAISDINNILDNFDFVGVYNATTNYRKYNFVRLNKDTYVALKDNLGITPSDDGVNWRLVAAGGINGQGAVNTVNNLEPDSNGNVNLQASDIGAASATDLVTISESVDELDTRVTQHLDDYEQDRLLTITSIPKYSIFGNQLSKLKESLCNPLEQITGIAFIGDSITWGRTLSDNASFEPRSGALSDARDNFASPSFVNEFKRYIGKQYADNLLPTLSNWNASISGQSIVEYAVRHVLYPKNGDFTLSTTGTGTTVTEVTTVASITGHQWRLAATSSGTGVHELSFNFTGEQFTISLAVLASNNMDYELFVDGASKGVFKTAPGVDGFTVGNNNQRTHTFDYVRNKIVKIVTKQPAESGTNTLRIEGIIINKKIRISNQGIIGATSRSYLANSLPSAITAKDNFVFCQLGTNDRIINSSVPKGLNSFKSNLKSLLDVIIPLADVVLMCANPVVNEDDSVYSFNMQRVRDVIYRTSKENKLDVIDNYALFNGLANAIYTADGLHPNELGHKIIVRNIINSLENS